MAERNLFSDGHLLVLVVIDQVPASSIGTHTPSILWRSARARLPPHSDASMVEGLGASTPFTDAQHSRAQRLLPSLAENELPATFEEQGHPGLPEAHGIKITKHKPVLRHETRGSAVPIIMSASGGWEPSSHNFARTMVGETSATLDINPRSAPPSSSSSTPSTCRRARPPRWRPTHRTQPRSRALPQHSTLSPDLTQPDNHLRLKFFPVEIDQNLQVLDLLLQPACPSHDSSTLRPSARSPPRQKLPTSRARGDGGATNIHL